MNKLLLLPFFLLFFTSISVAQTCKLKTYTSNNWEYWEVSGNIKGKFKTYTAQDWDYWEMSGDISKLSAKAKAAVFFIPIFTSSIYIRGLAK